MLFVQHFALYICCVIKGGGGGVSLKFGCCDMFLKIVSLLEN